MRTTLCISLILLYAVTANAKIIFSASHNGNSTIYVMDDNGRKITPINDNPYSEFRPKWSPNGRRIAFMRDTTPNNNSTGPNIFIMNADGSNAQQLSEENRHTLDLRYSPDGKKILYNTRLTGLYTIDIDTRELNQIIRNHVYHCDWSPDGKQIVFINDDHDIIEINLWFVDANGDNMRQWTHPDPEKGTIHRFHPRWSPDGKQILYTEMDIVVNIIERDDGGTHLPPFLYAVCVGVCVYRNKLESLMGYGRIPPYKIMSVKNRQGGILMKYTLSWVHPRKIITGFRKVFNGVCIKNRVI